MRILGLIRMLVMVAVMIGPPERSALDGRAAPEREDELAEARGAVGSCAEK